MKGGKAFRGRCCLWQKVRAARQAVSSPLELLEACPKGRRFREENHGPHRLVVRMSRCGRDNQVQILVWAVWSRRGAAWQRQAASLLQGCAGSLMKEAFSVTSRLLSGCSANQAKEAMPCLLAGWGRGAGLAPWQST